MRMAGQLVHKVAHFKQTHSLAFLKRMSIPANKFNPKPLTPSQAHCS